jgi:hypothetical protein
VGEENSMKLMTLLGVAGRGFKVLHEQSLAEGGANVFFWVNVDILKPRLLLDQKSLMESCGISFKNGGMLWKLRIKSS